MTAWGLLLGHVVAFAIWPFLIVRAAPASRNAYFHATTAVLLVLAGVMGSVYALTIGDLRFSVGGIAYGAMIMTTVAMLAATREIQVVRDAIRLVITVNLFSIVVLTLASESLRAAARTVPQGVAPEAFSVSIPAIVVGGLLHILQLVALTFVIERVRARANRALTIAAATLAAYVAALAFDGLAFPALAIIAQPSLGAVLSVGWPAVAAKLVIAVLYAAALGVFLWRHQHPPQVDERPYDLRGLAFAPRRQLLSTVSDALAQSDEHSRQLARTMESMSDGVVLLSSSLEVTHVNASARRLLRQIGGDITGRRLWEAMPELGDTPVEAAVTETAANGQPHQVVTDRVVPDRWVEVRCFAGDPGVTVYLRDVTEQVVHEAQLERVALAEQRAADQLRELDRMKNAFLSAVSHELRTPLAVVQGLAATMLRFHEAQAEVAERHRIDVAIAGNAERLARLLDDLLDLDRLIHGATNPERTRVDLCEVTREAIESSNAADRADLDTPDSLVAEVDAIRFGRIVANLVDNATKYGGDGPIRVRLSTDGATARLSVLDHGPGIPSSQLDDVFAPFHRIDHDHPRPGTGVGLALVREFSRLHGGDAWAEDTNGHGAHIIVELPVHPAGDDATGEAPGGSTATGDALPTDPSGITTGPR